MANHFIADLHLMHGNVIRYDPRPFSDLDEMHKVIIENWNAVIRPTDIVYILGDFVFANAIRWPQFIEALSGKKVLIRGNHDLRMMDTSLRNSFEDVRDYMELFDSDKHLILSHYPMPIHKHDCKEDFWMLNGHVHTTHEYDILKHLRKKIKKQSDNEGYPKGNFINVDCMMPWMNYTPRTVDEIIEGDKAASDWMTI